MQDPEFMSVRDILRPPPAKRDAVIRRQAELAARLYASNLELREWLAFAEDAEEIEVGATRGPAGDGST